MIEHIAPLCRRCTRSCNHILTSAVLITFLSDYQAAIKIHITRATDKIHRTMNLRVLHIMATLLTMTVIGILIRQHPHTFKDGVVALILPTNGTTGRSTTVIVQRIL